MFVDLDSKLYKRLLHHFMQGAQLFYNWLSIILFWLVVIDL